MKLKSKIAFALVMATPLIVHAGTTSVDPTKPETVSAKVINVIDGDTVEIKVGESTETLRLDAIDAPDVALESGIKAKDALAKLVLNKSVKAVIAGRVALGQGNVKTLYTFGNLKVGATDVALEQVTEGNALVFHQNPNASADLLKAEDVAKAQNLGFWAELGSNEAVQNWVDSTIVDASAQSVDTIESVNEAAENARAWRQLGWGSLPNCSKLVDGGQSCRYVKWPWPAKGGKNICVPNAPRLVTAAQKWTVDINEPTTAELQAAVGGVGQDIVNAVAQEAGKCTLIGIGAAGVSSFYSGGTAAKITFDGSWLGCVKIASAANPTLSAKGIALSVFQNVLSKYQFRAGSSCAW